MHNLSMLWQEDIKDQSVLTNEQVQDCAFRITCREIPVDHAWDLREEILNVLPWLTDEPQAAIHSIHSASSANGWIRPSLDSGNLIQLSRRTRLYLRLPIRRIDDAKVLIGKELLIAGCSILINETGQHRLFPSSTLFTRSMDANQVKDEQAFEDHVIHLLSKIGVVPKKILCGLAHEISCNDHNIPARSVLLADLEPHESIRIQESGLGSNGLLGCGIFLPHKSLNAVNTTSSMSD
ncbi:MAG: type I-MYXAN CRISPR-associated protein Cas6/Cmx6 [Gammaproteobacteria bacterium]|nr:type I-MYXAN CRISPR-associated protein Cas6/Cmx6 [Gammaproteobacteria bacterium]